MCKKLLILSLCISVLFVFSAPISSVDAGGRGIVNWRIAGTIVQLINVNSPFIGPVGDHSLINLTADGPPGPAKITLLSMSRPYIDGVDPSFTCPPNYSDGHYFFDKNDMIALFPGQSLLFASIAEEGGHLCVGLTKGTYFTVQMNVNAGTGRFKDVSGGNLKGEGYGYFVVPPLAGGDLTLVGENGKITGTIEFSD